MLDPVVTLRSLEAADAELRDARARAAALEAELAGRREHCRTLSQEAASMLDRTQDLESVLRRFLAVEDGPCRTGGGFCHAHDFELPCPVADGRRMLGDVP